MIVLLKYNEKGFLLPDSIHSAAMYHAKLFVDGAERGEYIFRIHDCITGIRLRGELRKEEDFDEAIEKTKALAEALLKFSSHISQLKTINFPK